MQHKSNLIFTYTLYTLLFKRWYVQVIKNTDLVKICDFSTVTVLHQSESRIDTCWCVANFFQSKQKTNSYDQHSGVCVFWTKCLILTTIGMHIIPLDPTSSSQFFTYRSQ